MKAYTREQRCTSTLSLTSTLDGGSWSTSRRETPGTHCTGKSVGLGAGLYGYKHLAPPPPTVVRTPNRPVRSESLHRLRYPVQHAANKCKEVPLKHQCEPTQYLRTTLHPYRTVMLSQRNNAYWPAFLFESCLGQFSSTRQTFPSVLSTQRSDTQIWLAHVR
jgi:hypothetical protein